MTTTRAIPIEILKFRLNKQLSQLKSQLSETCDNFGDSNGGFELYQRVLAWFIMGRLSKTEYDRMLEKVLGGERSSELTGKSMRFLN